MELPDTFEGGDLRENLDEILALLESELPELAASAAMLEQNPELFVFWAFDTESQAGYLTNVNVIRQELPGAFPIDLILESTLTQLPASFEVIESEVVEINDREVGRLITEGEIMNFGFRALQFLLVDEDNVMWVLSYGTSIDEFEDRLPIFEESFETFTIVPES